ncbi:MAG: ribonuclease P protein component [Spirochaetaceae bacterium]|nr:ribonuclease P protein component [Spirochaetaceae bacterium]
MQTRKSPIDEPFLNPPVTGRFRRREHLKKRTEITRVFKKGRVVGCPGVRLFFLKNALPYNRLVITFTRKFGNAVQRNRARRLGREAYRSIREKLKTGYDLVIVVYPRNDPEGIKPGLAGTREQLKTLFTRTGIL